MTEDDYSYMSFETTIRDHGPDADACLESNGISLRAIREFEYPARSRTVAEARGRIFHTADGADFDLYDSIDGSHVRLYKSLFDRNGWPTDALEDVLAENFGKDDEFPPRLHIHLNRVTLSRKKERKSLIKAIERLMVAQADGRVLITAENVGELGEIGFIEFNELQIFWTGA
jgi:hypothetical protein